MERLFFKKIELWLVLLLLVVAAIGMIIFGALVRNVAAGHDRFGRAGEIAYAVASVPANVQDLLRSRADNFMSTPDQSRFAGKDGWSKGPSDQPLDGYLLLSRYDGDVDRHVVELVELQSQKVLHRLVTDSEVFFQDWRSNLENEFAEPWAPERFRAIHPILTADGDFLIKDHHSPLVRVTPCGELVWRNESREFHHSLEMDAEGNFWVPSRLPLAAELGMAGDFKNSALANVNSEGEILFERSLGDLFVENGLAHLIVEVSDYKSNTMHLNDIEPVLRDGPYWKKGDVFLSMRELSMVLQYRPSTDEIVWMKRGPWLGQHDVDFVDDTRIAIFNNDSVNTGNTVRVRETNQISVYDFGTGNVSRYQNSALQEQDVRTRFGGLFSLLPNEALMVEETTQGRLLFLDKDGELALEFVNRAEDGKVYFLGWSRFLSPADGERAMAQFTAANCNGA